MPMVLMMAAATGGGGHGSAQTAYSAAGTLTSADGGYENYSFRLWTSALSFTGTITQCRVRFIGHPSLASQADNVSIGKQSASDTTTATPVELKTGGASGWTIPGGGTQYTDWTDIPSLFTTSGSDVAVVIVDVANANGNTGYASSGNSRFYASTNSYNSSSGGGGTSSALKRWFDIIEVRT